MYVKYISIYIIIHVDGFSFVLAASVCNSFKDSILYVLYIAHSYNIVIRNTMFISNLIIFICNNYRYHFNVFLDYVKYMSLFQCNLLKHVAAAYCINK